MNIQELIKKYEEKYETVFGFPVIQLNQILEDLKQLDEPQKVTIPQFVADWIEKVGGKLFGLNYDSVPIEIYDWVYGEDGEEGNLKKIHLACAIGYEIEKEKRYLVKIIGIKDYYSYLNYRKEENSWTVESKMEVDTIRTSHTKKELEEAGFGWVFDCEGIEIEEVEG